MKIFNQSVFEKWPIEDNSVQSIITSPPYWGLRKYDIPDIEINGWKGQYGLEKSYKSYIDHTRLWAKEAWRVLKDDGIFFLNIGDSYSSHKDCKQVAQSVSIGKPSEEAYILSKGDSPSRDSRQLKFDGMKNKCKMLIPHRIAIALIEDGWILRNDIIWYKPSCMPESCQDRFSKKWESIFMFVKSEKYYFDLNIVKEPTKTKDTIIRDRDTTKLNNVPGRSRMGGLKENNYDFKNPGDMWSINPQPSSEKHYAMWPEKLVERMILCSTKPDDVVLDPFCGSATTLKIAIKNNRQAVGIDLGYSDIQERKLNNIQINLI